MPPLRQAGTPATTLVAIDESHDQSGVAFARISFHSSLCGLCNQPMGETVTNFRLALRVFPDVRRLGG